MALVGLFVVLVVLSRGTPLRAPRERLALPVPLSLSWGSLGPPLGGRRERLWDPRATWMCEVDPRGDLGQLSPQKGVLAKPLFLSSQ